MRMNDHGFAAHKSLTHNEDDQVWDDINITLDQSVIYDNVRIFRERVKTSWGRDSMLLKDLLESRHHHRIYMNKTKQSKREFNASRAYTKG
jgi:hypothetical protein